MNWLKITSVYNLYETFSENTWWCVTVKTNKQTKNVFSLIGFTQAQRNKKHSVVNISSFLPLLFSITWEENAERSTGAMNQGRVFGAQLAPGYCPQAHNSSTANPQALSKMTSVPREKRKAKGRAGLESLFLSQSKNDWRPASLPW